LFLIDTSVWIFVLGPRPLEALRDRVAALVLENQAATTPPILFEILRGARTLHEAESLKQRLRSLHVLPFLEADWSESAEWGARLSRKGVSTKSMDILIAFKAAQQGLILLHADRDFDRMARHATLQVESWADRIRDRS
jgi:predicted nucleic acid-binding protein